VKSHTSLSSEKHLTTSCSSA